MSFPLSALSAGERPASGGEQGPSGRRLGYWRTVLMLLLLAALIALALFGGQWLQGQQNRMVPGRPLSYPQTHLHTLALSPRPGIVYLGTHYGLFTSTDRGQSWPQSQGALSTSMISAIAISPTNPDLLAVLAIPTSGLSMRMGVYVSADAGKNWSYRSPASLPGTAYPYTMQSAAGAGGHFYVFFSYDGWFETQDLGLHWSPITRGSLNGIQTPTLLSDPANPAHLLMGGSSGLYETYDDGQHWQAITAISGGVIALVATVPPDGQGRSILVATDQGLYRWQERPGGQTSPAQLNSLPTLSPPTRLALSQDGSALYAISGSTCWFSPDLGQTWQQRGQFSRGDLVTLALDPRNDRELLAGFYYPALVQISTDAASTWRTLTY